MGISHMRISRQGWIDSSFIPVHQEVGVRDLATWRLLHLLLLLLLLRLLPVLEATNVDIVDTRDSIVSMLPTQVMPPRPPKASSTPTVVNPTYISIDTRHGNCSLDAIHTAMLASPCRLHSSHALGLSSIGYRDTTYITYTQDNSVSHYHCHRPIHHGPIHRSFDCCSHLPSSSSRQITWITLWGHRRT